MPAGMNNPKRTFVKTIKGSRQDGTPVEIDHYLMSGEDPTSTGSIFRNSISYPFYKLKNGEEVEVYDDGTAMISNTGEMLKVV